MTNHFFTREEAFRKSIVAELVETYGIDTSFPIGSDDKGNERTLVINRFGVVQIHCSDIVSGSRLLLDYGTSEMIEFLEYLPQPKHYKKA